jgi:hypothetical protein
MKKDEAEARVRQAYNKAIDLKIITPAMILNYV